MSHQHLLNTSASWFRLLLRLYPPDFREEMGDALLGVLLALPGIYVAGGVIRGVLIGVTPTDPVTLVAVAFSLALVTIASCYVPARRALSIDPAQLLLQG